MRTTTETGRSFLWRTFWGTRSSSRPNSKKIRVAARGAPHCGQVKRRIRRKSAGTLLCFAWNVILCVHHFLLKLQFCRSLEAQCRGPRRKCLSPNSNFKRKARSWIFYLYTPQCHILIECHDLGASSSSTPWPHPSAPVTTAPDLQRRPMTESTPSTSPTFRGEDSWECSRGNASSGRFLCVADSWIRKTIPSLIWTPRFTTKGRTLTNDRGHSYMMSALGGWGEWGLVRKWSKQGRMRCVYSILSISGSW